MRAAARAETGGPAAAPLRTERVRLMEEELVPVPLVVVVEAAGALRAVLGVLPVPLEGGFLGGGVEVDMLVA